MHEAHEPYTNAIGIPYLKAIGSDRLAPFYDIVARLVMNERRVRRRVIVRAALGPRKRLLDIGCGTGTLALMAQRRYPNAEVVGVDGDPVILDIARRKAAREGVAVPFDEGMSYALPYPDASFDAVTSTLMLHHLTQDQQARTLAEVRRVLRPGGRFVIADLAPPHNWRMTLASRAMRLLSGMRHGGSHHSRGTPHVAATERHGGHVPHDLGAMLTAHGWGHISPPAYFMTLMGTLSLVSAVRPLDHAATGAQTAQDAPVATAPPGEPAADHLAHRRLQGLGQG
jgi:ubiquinone/menaquinone biosynthesis C-methylase UbiE